MKDARVIKLPVRNPDCSGNTHAGPNTLFPETAGADFSPDRVWRYRLWRTWDDSLPYANFLMLNPSSADETESDPTVTRCVNFASRWGYGGLYVTNLFALVSTDPEALYSSSDPVGRDNDRTILRVAQNAGIVICAWGNHGTHSERRDAVMSNLRAAGIRLNYIKLNGTGEPSHPLYLPAAMEPKSWD